MLSRNGTLHIAAGLEIYVALIGIIAASQFIYRKQRIEKLKEQ